MVAVYNLTDITDQDISIYSSVALIGFQQAMQLDWCIPEQSRRVCLGGRTVEFPLIAARGRMTNGLGGAALSATASGISWVSCTVAQKRLLESFSEMLISQGPLSEIIPGFILAHAQNMGREHDELAADCLVAGSQVAYVTGSAMDAQTTSSLLTKSHAQKAWQKLHSAGVTPFQTAGGPRYAALVHSDVAADLKAEASGLMLPGVYGTNGSAGTNMLADAYGFIWVESPLDALVSVNGGAASVSAYNSVFFGSGALAKAVGPIAPNVFATDLAVFPDRSGVIRVLPQLTNGGGETELAAILRVGFCVTQQAGVYRYVSGSSLGA